MTATASSADPPVVRIRGLKKSFGAVSVLDGVDLDVRRGDVVSVIGPSGSGKTTLLRCINALETYDGGSVQIDEVEVGFRDSSGRGGVGMNASCLRFGRRQGWCSSCSTCFRI